MTSTRCKTNFKLLGIRDDDLTLLPDDCNSKPLGTVAFFDRRVPIVGNTNADTREYQRRVIQLERQFWWDRPELFQTGGQSCRL